MYSLKEFLTKVAGMKEKDIPSDIIFCHSTNREISLLTNAMKDFLDCFTFTLIKKGHCTILYNDQEIKLIENDLYIYTAGLYVEIIDISEDYEGMCLMVDKGIMFENTLAHNVIKAAYFPVIRLDEPKIHLDEKTLYRVNGEMTEIAFFLNSNRRLKTEASQLIFSLMLLDIIEFLESTGQYKLYSQKEETFVVEFMKLLSKNFKSEHGVVFYARKLNISSVYLSRIVKHHTGKTVVAHINELLVKEAAWMLNSTSKSIKEIARILNFADQASFNKFFKRIKGISPLKFRNRLS